MIVDALFLFGGCIAGINGSQGFILFGELTLTEPGPHDFCLILDDQGTDLAQDIRQDHGIVENGEAEVFKAVLHDGIQQVRFIIGTAGSRGGLSAAGQGVRCQRFAVHDPAADQRHTAQRRFPVQGRGIAARGKDDGFFHRQMISCDYYIGFASVLYTCRSSGPGHAMPVFPHIHAEKTNTTGCIK